MGVYLWVGPAIDHAVLLQQTVDGGYVVAGLPRFLSGRAVGDAWIVKLDENGVVAWQKAYGTPGSDYPYSARQTQDGGYIMVGYTAFGAGSGDAWIVKLDASGECHLAEGLMGGQDMMLPAPFSKLRMEGISWQGVRIFPSA